MSISICTGKLHRARVTEARLDYEGSITIDPVLMKEAGFEPFQLVHINSLSNAAHWETYIITGTPGKGEICMNGSPARLFYPGDLVVIMAFEQLTREEAAKVEQRVVHMDANNHVVQVEVKPAHKCHGKEC